MKRSHWLFLLCAAAFGLAPSFAWSVTPFEALEFSTVNINGNGTGTSSGLIKLQNTGLVIDNLAGSSYTPLGQTAPIPGFAGMVAAVYDGADGMNQDWNATAGITGINAQANPSLYDLAFDYESNLGYTSWGGVNLGTAEANAFLIRETYLGDSTLAGSVGAIDYTAWSASYGKTAPFPYYPNGLGNSVGDYDYNNLIFGGPVDSGAYSAWSATYGKPPLGGGSFTGPVQAVAGAAATPEPSSIALLFVALAAVGCVKSRFRNLLGKGLRGMSAARLLLLISCLVLGFAMVANADMTYILRPVTGDPTDTNEGSYTIKGDGITAPWTVTLAAGSSNKDVSFELFAALYNPTNSTGWVNQGLQQAQVWINNTPGTTPLAWTADSTNSALYGAAANWTASTVGGAGSVASQWGVPTWSVPSPPATVLNAQASPAGQHYPSSTMDLLNNAGTAWSATPPSAMNLTVGTNTDTWTLVKVADLSINLGTLTNGESTIIQALPATRTGNGRTSAQVIYNGTPGTAGSTDLLQASQILTSLASSGGSTLGVDVMVASGTSSWYAGRVDISGIPSSYPDLLGTSTLAVSGTVTNTTYSGTGTQDTVDWQVAGAPTSSFSSPVAMTGLVAGNSAPFSLTYTPPATTFGPVGLAITASGSGQNQTGAALTNSPVTSMVNVLGVASAAGVTLTSGSIGVGATLGSPSVLQTQINANASAGLLGTTAAILGSDPTTVATSGIGETWRARLASEIAVPGGVSLFSDVVAVTGVPTGTPYALEMNFSLAELLKATTFPTALAAAQAGQLYLGYEANGSSSWVNVSGIGGSTPTFNNESYSAFLANNSGKSLSSLVGNYGLDGSNVWAVIPSSANGGSFAVVPEPGTLALLAAGALALGFFYRRRKVAKA